MIEYFATVRDSVLFWDHQQLTKVYRFASQRRAVEAFEKWQRDGEPLSGWVDSWEPGRIPEKEITQGERVEEAQVGSRRTE